MSRLRDGWILGGSDKVYKWYLERPYTPKERQGMIRMIGGVDDVHGISVAKFYTVHLPRAHCLELLSMWKEKTLNHTLYVNPWLPALSEFAPPWLQQGT